MTGLTIGLRVLNLDGSGVNACLTRTVGAIRYQTGVTAAAVRVVNVVPK